MSEKIWRPLAAVMILLLGACNVPGALTPTAGAPAGATTTATVTQTVPPPAASASATASPAPTDQPATSRPTTRPVSSGGGGQAPTSAPSGNEPAPVIDSLTVSAESVRPGDTVSVAWHSNAGTVQVQVVTGTGQVVAIGAKPGSGSLEYTVDAKERNPFQVQVVAGPSAAPAYKSVLIGIICPDAWVFDGAPDTCPDPAQQGSWVAERFEHGNMYWIGGSGLIIALRSDGIWTSVSDTWQPGMPESDPSLTPPDGLFQPVRGFGKVWREAVDHDALGWALAPEFATTLTYQCDSRFKSAVCILKGPDGAFLLNIWGGGYKPFTS